MIKTIKKANIPKKLSIAIFVTLESSIKVYFIYNVIVSII